MSEEQASLPPISADDLEALLNISDVISIKLSREGRAWRCVANGLRVSGGATGKTSVVAIHDAVVAHNLEWGKEVDV